MNNEPSQPQPSVSSVSVRVPPFRRANVALWFCQLEAQFETSRISSDKTKYNTVVASIESSVLTQVSDIVLNPPDENLYVNLKTKILERFADSNQSRLKKVLNDLTLGDRKPSQLLREMRELAGDSFSNEVLKSLWMQRLPTQMQVILSVSSEELNTLAEMADKISDVSCFEICSSSSLDKLSNRDVLKPSDLIERIDDLAKQVSEIGRSRSKSRSFSKPKFHNRSHSRSDGAKIKGRFCWYHFNFGKKALKCVKPCTFSSDENNLKTQKN